MKRWLLLLFVLSLALQTVIRADSNGDKGLLIVEVQTGSESSASAEFVEIANISFEPQGLKNIELQYMPAGGGNWRNKAQLNGHMHAHGRLLINSEQSGLDGEEMSSGLAKSGGHIRLYDVSIDKEIDRLGWGSASEPLEEAANAPDEGQSLKRINDEDGYFQNQGNNFDDWHISDNPTPHSDPLYLPEDESADGEPPSTGGDTEPDPPSDKPVQTKSYAKVTISELLPDPDKPLSDAKDEFVEIYNPNSFDVKLDGYVLKSGSELRNSQALEGLLVKAKSYIVLTSADTNISLSNSGGLVSLMDGNQNQISQSRYEDAETGLSWSLYGGDWQWSQPTPGQANLPPQADAAVNGESQSAVLSTDFTNGSGSNNQGDISNGRNIFEDPPEAEIAPIDYTILASVGGLAIIYVIYEYRHDIGNRIARLRGYNESRKENRRELKGRRSNRISQRYRRWQDGLRARISRWHKQSR